MVIIVASHPCAVEALRNKCQAFEASLKHSGTFLLHRFAQPQPSKQQWAASVVGY
jgi:hypothetical protein